MLRERHAAKQLFDRIERKHISDFLHPEQLDPGPIPEYKSFKVIQEPPLPDLRGQILDSSDIEIEIEPLTEAEKQQEEEIRRLEEMFADYDSKNPYEDNLPDYFDDEDDEEPQDQS